MVWRYLGHDPAEQIGADMGSGLDQDTGGSPSQDQFFQDRLAARILEIGGQFAIGKGPGATFTKLDIVFRIERTTVPEPFNRIFALCNRLAAFDDTWFEACLSQGQGCKQPGRAAADNHRPLRIW